MAVYTQIDDASLFYKTVIFTGDGNNSRAITVGFQPDIVWCRQRDDDSGGWLIDSTRGNNAALQTTNANAEGTFASMTFESNGITVSGNENLNNENAHKYVVWNWKTGTSFSNDASATGIGSLDSSGSVSDTAGISIVSYTGNATASTLKHGLSTKPNMIIVKGRIAARNWIVGHNEEGLTKSTVMDSAGTFSSQTHWNNTDPTTSVFTIEGGASSNVNTDSAAYISYCFSDRQGFLRTGKYTGNGSNDGTFVYCGFRPAFVLLKRTDSATEWQLIDNERSNQGGLNIIDLVMAPSTTTYPDYDDGTNWFADFYSNGFKLRNGGAAGNNSGSTFIYLAFAESPFVNSKGVPTNAR